MLALLLLVAALCTPSQLVAQALTGSLSGIVMDRSSAVVPNAKITVTNENSGDVRRSTSNNVGYFAVSSILPGSYSVLVEAPGFSGWKVEKLVFTAGDSKTLGEVTLDVATTGSEIKVTANLEDLTPLDSGEKSIALSSKEMANVAIVGQSAAEYIKIMPGMVAISPGVENRPGFNGENIGINGNGDGGKQSAIGNFSANGTRSNALDITADGSSVSDPGCNCATPVNPNPEMIDEFKVQQSNFAAENAKGPVVMNTITKGGGKDFHGSAFFYARNYVMNANDWLNNANRVKRPENSYYFPGGTIGGPVFIPGKFNKNRDKLFFFTGLEYFKQTIDTGLLRAQTLTPEMRQGNFSNSAYLEALNKASAAGGAPINQTMFPGGIIPASQLDPGMTNWIKLLPQPNRNPAGDGQGYNWVDVLTVNQNMWQSLSRVDYNISETAKLFVRFNYQKERQPFPVQLWWRNSGSVPMPTPINGDNRTDSISANFTKVFSPTVTNEFNFGYTFVDFPNSYEDYDKMTKTAVGFPYTGPFKGDNKIPGMLSWAGPTASMWLAGGFDPILFATKHLWTFYDNFSKVMGTHTLKFGAYYGYISNAQPGNDPTAGLGFYSPWGSLTSGNVLADMTRGALDNWNQYSTMINRNMGYSEFAAFAQDNWKITPRLTLEYGLRIQHIQPWTAKNGIGIATWDTSTYSPTAPPASLPGINWYKKDPANIPLAGWDTRALFYAPRAGFAYDIFGKGKTVIRGGWGIFNYHDPQLAAGAMDLPAGVRSVTIPNVYLNQIDTPGVATGLVFGGEAVDRRDSRQPTTQTYSLTVSQRLPGRILFDVAYVGSKSTSLVNQGNRLPNINQVPLGAMLNDPTGDANAYRVLKNWQVLNVRNHNFTSNYNSLQVTGSKTYGIANFTLAYTWSKALGILDTQFNGLRIQDNYGALGFDRTQTFAASYVINIPTPRSDNAFVRGSLGGWQVSGIVQMSTGVNLQQNGAGGDGNFNLNVAYQGRSMSANDVYGTPSISLTARLTCDPRGDGSGGVYIKANCLAAPIAGVNGGYGVGGAFVYPTLRGPGFFNTDMSLFKNFKMGETRTLQFRASGYNLPNHPNASFVNGDQNLQLGWNAAGQLNNPRFGIADSKVGRRIIQLGLRFLF